MLLRVEKHLHLTSSYLLSMTTRLVVRTRTGSSWNSNHESRCNERNIKNKGVYEVCSSAGGVAAYSSLLEYYALKKCKWLHGHFLVNKTSTCTHSLRTGKLKCSLS